MKSSNEALLQRGYVNNIFLTAYQTKSNEELLEMLKSVKAFERTVAVRLLDVNENTAAHLIAVLKKEKALYTKIELEHKLALGDDTVCKMLISQINAINNYQHKLPTAPSKKKSYPLARDVFARILGHMDKKVFQTLVDYLTMDNASELIDAIGYMVFYNKRLDTKENYQFFKQRVEPFLLKDVVLWKYITSLSAFINYESIDFLQAQTQSLDIDIVLNAYRSLQIISMRSNNKS